MYTPWASESQHPKTPRLDQGHPDWWISKGDKMRVVEFSSACSIEIVASVAGLIITRTGDQYDVSPWTVLWKVIQAKDVAFVQGKLDFSDTELKAAFNLLGGKNYCGSGQHILNRFGGTVAEQGKFIRWGDFLNIPCPGTGFQGDPNVSIYVSEEIRDAVGRLFG